MEEGCTPTCATMTKAESKSSRTHVAGVHFFTTRQIAINILGSPELEAIVDCAGGTIDKSKGTYLKILSYVYETSSKFTTLYTRSVTVFSFTYDE